MPQVEGVFDTEDGERHTGSKGKTSQETTDFLWYGILW